MAELWGVFCEDFGENWSSYNRTTLYFIEQDYNKNWKSLAFDVIRTLGMSNQIIFYNLQIIWLLLSIDLDT